MAAEIDFSDARLSALPPGLEASAALPPVVGPAQNLVLYAATVPFEAPPEDPEADPEVRESAMANERFGPVFAEVSDFQCGADGARWVYVGREPDTRMREWQGQKIFEDIRWLVVDHAKKAEIGAGRPFLSPDGRVLAYTQTIWDEKTGYPKSRVVVDDHAGPLFLTVEPAGFGAGNRLAYRACDGEQFGVIVDGEPMGPYGDVQELRWSPDGTRLAYAAGDPGSFERYLVVDGKKGAAHASVHGLRFSPDGRRVAYVAGEAGGFRVVVDGEAGPLFKYCPELWFSGDGRSVIAKVGLGDGWTVAVDGRAGASFDEIGPPVFSRDATTLAFAGKRGGRSHVVVNGVASAPCDFVYRIAVGERGGVAYALMQDKTFTVTHNGREVLRDGARPNHLLISPDGAMLARSEKLADQVRLVVDGVAGEPFTSIDRLGFAPDGKTAVYAAQDGDRPFLVVGTRRHGPMLPLTDPVYSPRGDALSLVAKLGREIWRKTIPLRPTS